MDSLLKNFKVLPGFLEVRAGEWRAVLAMSGASFLVTTAFVIFRPMRNALFLEKLDAAQLPYVFILVAFIAGSIGLQYARYSARASLKRLTNTATFVIVFNLALFWWLFQMHQLGRAMPYLFYIWVSLYGVIAPSQVWLQCNHIFDSRQAKRLFAIVGSGAILGGIVGGYLTTLYITNFGGRAIDLLWVCAALQIGTLALQNLAGWGEAAIRRGNPTGTRADDTDGPGSVFKLIAQSRYLQLIIGTIALMSMVTTIVDYQFSAIVQADPALAPNGIPDGDKMASFFGFWFANFSMISLGLQLALTGFLLRRFGVAVALAILPAGFFLASIFVFIAPVLWTGLLLKGVEGCFRYSTFKSALETLFVPVNPQVKNQTKPFIDTVADRLPVGLAGLMLLILASGPLKGPRGASLLNLFLVVAWLFVVWRMRQAYVNELRLGLEKRTLIVASSDLLGSEAAARTMIFETMQSRDERVVLHALAQTEEAKEPSLVNYFTSLLHHPSPQVVSASLRNLRRHHGPQILQAAENLAKSASPEIRREALQYLLEQAPDKLGLLRRLLNEADPQLRAVTIALALSGDVPGAEAALDEAMLDSLFEQTTEEAEMARRALARSLGRREMPHRLADLPRLLRDPKASVVSAAMIAAGRLQLLEHVPLVLNGLENRHTRYAARTALALCGEKVVPRLSEILNDDTQPFAVRARIPKILGMIATRSAVDNLLAAFPRAENLLKAQILHALDDLRRAAPRESLKFPADKITELLRAEAGQAFRLAAIARTLAVDRAANGQAFDGRAGKLLQRTLREQWEQRRRWVVLLLGLLYNREDMDGVYRGLRSTQPRIRAHAIEFLDNLLKGETKSYVFPLIDDIALENVATEGEKLLQLKIQNANQAYAALFELNHPWLSACAIHALAEAETLDRSLIKKFKDSSHTMIREAAASVLQSLTSKENGTKS
ncbi:MAG: HEAT repeat domain-containing protein [candidate division KSB1 bacterium]|nr:HEAT repeat domain-containing protein [candidate division KSB1 bacterium]